jgi:uncharacterized membrane protein YecN with MAPEG domain
MNLPITSLLTGIMALIIMVLSIRLNMRRIDIGGSAFTFLTDGDGDEDLRRRKIAYESAVNNSAISLILLGLIEFGGASQIQVIALAAAFLVARIVHVLATMFQVVPKWRSFASLIQYAYYLVTGIWLVFNAYFMLLIK